MADIRRLTALGMSPELATEVAAQMGSGGAVASVNGQTGAVTLQGVAVPDAAGAAPTKAEFDALLASLRTATVLAT